MFSISTFFFGPKKSANISDQNICSLLTDSLTLLASLKISDEYEFETGLHTNGKAILTIEEC